VTSAEPNPQHRTGLFPALLRHWRSRRGLSQLDLAAIAEVSARHISFLETGRARPSPEMVVCLCRAMDVPLRHANALLRAAGHEPRFDERAELPGPVWDALRTMAEHHEPYPLVVLDRSYGVIDVNRGATALLGVVLGDGALGDGALDDGTRAPNLARLTFDPAGAQPRIVNFDEVGRQLLWRVQREALDDPDDGALQELLDELLSMPTVDPDWRHVDLEVPSDPMLVLHLRVLGTDLRFLTTITSFQAPQHVAVEQLRIETWYPYDDATAAACRALAGPGPSVA
jgi:transcriptional regulator with XRE-family HTH domain